VNTLSIPLISDIAIIVSAVVVASVAIYGLYTWLREMTGKAKFDIARKSMFLSRKLVEDFKWARLPVTYSDEPANRPRQDAESPEVSRVLDQWYSRNQRLQPLIEDLKALEEIGWECEVLLTDEASQSVVETITTFRYQKADLSTAIYSYFEVQHDKALGRDVSQHDAWCRELCLIIYGREGDEFFTKIMGAREKVFSVLKPYVK